MKKLLFMFVMVLTAQLSFAQTPKEDAVKYLKSSGMEERFAEMKGQILPMIPQEKQASFTNEIDEAIKGFYNKQAELIVKYYDANTLKDAVKKYEATKTFAQLPAPTEANAKKLGEESTAVGEEFGLTIQGIAMKYLPEGALTGEE